MNITSFIVKASSERSDKSLGCLIPMIIGRVPRLSRRNKEFQIKVGSSRLFDTFLAMKKVWHYKIRFSISLMKNKMHFIILYFFYCQKSIKKSRTSYFYMKLFVPS